MGGKNRTNIHAFTDDTLVELDSGDEIVQPEKFKSAEAELKWLHTRAEPLSQVLKDPNRANFIQPTKLNFWPGTVNALDARPEITVQKLAITNFNRNQLQIIADQR